GVEDGPVSDGVAAVLHGLGLAIGRGHAAGVEVIAAYDDGRAHLAGAHQIVDHLAEARPLAVAEPADAGGQALELHPLAGQLDPAHHRWVAGELAKHHVVYLVDVLGVAGERGPAEWASALAEERAYVRGHEPRKGEGIGHALAVRLLAYVVAVVEHHRAHPLQVEHGPHVHG